MSQWSQPDESNRAVNGIKNGEFSFHTDIETDAWWQVDLDGVFSLEEIVVYNRGMKGSPFSERARSMAIFVSLDGMTWEKLYFGGESFGGALDNAPLRVACAGKGARFVRLQLQEQNYLHLDQVEIFSQSARPCNPVLFSNTNPSLVSLGSRYGTDKVPHGFCAVYEKLFCEMRLRTTKVLEIGVFFGASLCMWRDWFPQATIHGADHFTGQQGNGRFFENADRFFKEVTAGLHPRIVLHELDQSKRGDLARFSDEHLQGTFDLVVDDASHLMRDQQQTLAVLFCLVKPGGYFVIEDIHSSLGSDYDVEPDGSNSTLSMIQAAIAGHGWHSRYMNRQEEDFLNDAADLSNTKIYDSGGSQTCVIRRRASTMTASTTATKPGGVVFTNYATVDELNHTRQQQNISWARQWGAEAIVDPSSVVTSYDIACFGPDSLDEQFCKQNESILTHKRGGGYWLWKPYILAAMLASTDAEYVIYCDCGSTIIKPLASVIQVMRETGAAILAFDMTSNGRLEYQWTKGEVLRAFNAEDAAFAATGQITGAVSVWRVCDASREFVDAWLKLMQFPEFATDAPSADGGGDTPGFVEHRHDQSIFSLLIKQGMQNSSPEKPLAVTQDFRTWIGHHHIS